MRMILHRKLHVLHVGENLIEIARVQRVCPELNLRRMGVILRVDDQHAAFIPARQCDVRLHQRQHVAHAVVELPVNLRSRGDDFRMLPAVVVEDELLIQAAHALLVQKVCHAKRAVLLTLKQPLDNQPAHCNQHPVCLIVSVVLHMPVDGEQIDLIHIGKEHEQTANVLSARLADVAAKQQHQCAFDDLIHRGIDGEIIVRTDELTFQQRLRFDGLRHFNPSARRGQAFRAKHIVPPKPLLHLIGHAFAENGRAQIRYVVKCLRRQ